MEKESGGESREKVSAFLLGRDEDRIGDTDFTNLFTDKEWQKEQIEKGYAIKLPGITIYEDRPIHSARKYNFREFRKHENWCEISPSTVEEIAYWLIKSKGGNEELYYTLRFIWEANGTSAWYKHTFLLDYNTSIRNLRFVKKMESYLLRIAPKIKFCNPINFCEGCNSLATFREGQCQSDNCIKQRQEQKVIKRRGAKTSRKIIRNSNHFPTILGVPQNPDKPIRQKIRFLLIEKTKEASPDESPQCQHCGRTVNKDSISLEVDHIIPLSKGGKTVEDNLQVFCYQCNHGKGNFTRKK